MAYVPRSSFIPNEASGAIPVHMQKKRTVRLFNVLAMTVLTLSIVSAVGVFFYEKYIQERLVEARAELDGVSKSSDKEKISEIRVYDNRLVLATELLDNHLAPTQLFAAIEKFTKEKVQFTSLDFQNDPGKEASVELAGVTDAFASVVLQKMQLANEPLFDEVITQEVGKTGGDISSAEGGSSASDTEENQNAAVSFGVTGVFNKAALTYTAPVEFVEEAPTSGDSNPANTGDVTE